MSAGPFAGKLQVQVVKRLPAFSLEVDWQGGDEVVALFGPSGAGKTLTLQCLAGLVRPDRGRIVVGGEVFFDSDAGIDVPTQRRRLGYVFQGYALFPHLSVEDNVGYGLRGRPREERRRRAGEVLERLGLGGLGARRPRELSGGQQQRVALGRALALDPGLLLLDEPLSALDTPLRRQLRRELAAILREWRKATVLVTHDLLEHPPDVALVARERREQRGAVLPFAVRQERAQFQLRHPLWPAKQDVALDLREQLSEERVGACEVLLASLDDLPRNRARLGLKLDLTAEDVLEAMPVDVRHVGTKRAEAARHLEALLVPPEELVAVPLPHVARATLARVRVVDGLHVRRPTATREPTRSVRRLDALDGDLAGPGRESKVNAPDLRRRKAFNGFHGVPVLHPPAPLAGDVPARPAPHCGPAEVNAPDRKPTRDHGACLLETVLSPRQALKRQQRTERRTEHRSKSLKPRPDLGLRAKPEPVDRDFRLHG